MMRNCPYISQLFNCLMLNMKAAKLVDCFMLMGTALSLQNDKIIKKSVLQDVFTTNVNVSLTLNEIYFKDTIRMEVELTFLLSQRWVDPRLGANQRTRKMAVNGQIWKPWLTATKGEVRFSENNQITQFWRGFSPEGNVLYSENVVLKTYCTTNYKTFPFDTQICQIKLGSYRFPKDEIELFWNELPVEILMQEHLNEFTLNNISTYSEVDVRSSGNFTVLVVDLTVKRNYEHYLFCTFLPSIFVVSISYFIFWIKTDYLNIRYYFSGLNLSVLYYFYQKSFCSTPQIQYLKAIDIFILICIVFVSSTLTVNCLVSLYFTEETMEHLYSRGFHRIQKKYDLKYKYLDRSMCAIYPILFICISIYYFIVLL